jgi:hypothetical protein
MGIDDSKLSSAEALRAALLIRRHDFGPATIEVLRAVIASDYDWVNVLIRNLVHAGGADGFSYDDAAAQAQHDLDDLARVDAIIGCTLMARLMPVVSSVIGLHQESDGTRIRVLECREPELLRNIETMAAREEEVIANIRDWYDGCIKFKKDQERKALNPPQAA